jgi:tripartite-type tricarboxylate transporter receptor subunit TctC
MTEVDEMRDVAFPSRAVRLIDPFGAGGGPDILGRALAERLSAIWGQRVMVQNHTGAGSTVAPALVAKARADGYTLLINTSAHAYSTVFSNALQPYVLVAGATSGITSVRELVDAAEACPGSLRFASAGIGTGTHIAVEKLNRDLRISAVHAPPGAADSMSDVVAGTAAGRTEYTMSPISFAAPHLQDGGLVPLGVSTVRRSQLLPEVPSLAEVGDAGFDFPIWYGIWAPARTPSAIVSKLCGDIARVLASAELSDWLIRHDAERLRMTQADFVAFVTSESERAVLLLSSD